MDPFNAIGLGARIHALIAASIKLIRRAQLTLKTPVQSKNAEPVEAEMTLQDLQSIQSLVGNALLRQDSTGPKDELLDILRQASENAKLAETSLARILSQNQRLTGRRRRDSFAMAVKSLFAEHELGQIERNLSDLKAKILV